MDERKFTDQEVQEILKRAVERNQATGLVENEGLSLTELKEIGSEVGIDPGRLEEAARALIQADQGGPNPIVGARTALNFQRTVEGEVDPGDTPEVLSVIRRVMGKSGEVSELHGSLEWKAVGESGERLVALTSRDGNTTVSASANLTNAAIMIFCGAGIPGIFASILGITQAADADSLAGIIFFFSLIPTLYLVLRTIFGRLLTSEAAKLQQVVDELALLAD